MGKKKLAHKWGEIDEEDNIVHKKNKSPQMSSIKNSTVQTYPIFSGDTFIIKELKSLIEDELLILEETNPVVGSYSDGYNEGSKAVYLYVKNFLSGE